MKVYALNHYSTLPPPGITLEDLVIAGVKKMQKNCSAHTCSLNNQSQIRELL